MNELGEAALAMLEWIEQHPGTAGWAQAAGATLALAITVWATVQATRTANRIAARPFVALLREAYDRASELGEALNESAPYESLRKIADTIDWARRLADHPEPFSALLDRPAGDWPNDKTRQSLRRLIQVMNDVEERVLAAISKEDELGVKNNMADLRTHPVYIAAYIDDFIHECRSACSELRVTRRHFRRRLFVERTRRNPGHHPDLRRHIQYLSAPGAERVRAAIRARLPLWLAQLI